MGLLPNSSFREETITLLLIAPILDHAESEEILIPRVGIHVMITVNVDELFYPELPPINDELLQPIQAKISSCVSDFGVSKDSFIVGVQMNKVIR